MKLIVLLTAFLFCTPLTSFCEVFVGKFKSHKRIEFSQFEHIKKLYCSKHGNCAPHKTLSITFTDGKRDVEVWTADKYIIFIMPTTKMSRKDFTYTVNIDDENKQIISVRSSFEDELMREYEDVQREDINWDDVVRRTEKSIKENEER